MPYRLAVRDGDRIVRHVLANGEATIGSAADADIRVAHPSISRRHARIHVSQQGISIEDLASRNGTRVDERRVSDVTSLAPGSRLTLGTVEASIETVSSDDLATGIAIASADETVPTETITTDPATTAESTVLEAFALKSLPSVLDAVAAGASFQEAASRIGDVLHRVLPAQRVEITRASGGVLFSADRGDADGWYPLSLEKDGFSIRVSFISERLARSYEALVGCAASVLQIADRRDAAPVSPRRRGTAPPLPQAAHGGEPAARSVCDRGADRGQRDRRLDTRRVRYGEGSHRSLHP